MRAPAGPMRRKVTMEALLKSLAHTFPACQRATISFSSLCRPPAQWLDNKAAVHTAPTSLASVFERVTMLRCLDLSLPPSHEPHLNTIVSARQATPTHRCAKHALLRSLSLSPALFPTLPPPVSAHPPAPPSPPKIQTVNPRSRRSHRQYKPCLNKTLNLEP